MKMSYASFNDEEEKLGKSLISTQLMMGVFPSEKYREKVKKKYQTPELIELPNKILEQDKNLVASSNLNFEKCQEINSQMDEALLKVGNKLEIIESSLNTNESENLYKKEFDSKVGQC